MTPRQIATLHCANHKPDGSCLGAVIEDDLHIRVCRPRPTCCVGTPGVRCGYFEQCVLPMNSGDWPGLKTPKQHQDFAEAIHEYQRAANVPSAKARVCACGRGLEPRHRMCYQCRRARVLENKRKWWNGRVSTRTLSPKGALQVL